MVIYKCPVCEEKVVPGKSETIEPCRCHLYIHQKCLEEWIDDLGNRSRCRTCKTHYQYETNRTFNNERVNKCCQTIFCTIMIILGYLIFISATLLTVYAHTTFDYWYSDYDSKGLVYPFGWGLPILVLTGGYAYLSIRIGFCLAYLKYKRTLTIGELDWGFYVCYVSGYYLANLIVETGFVILQIIGIFFLPIFRGKEPFHEFYPNLATFGVGVGMVTAIIFTILIFICCGRCCKNLCVKEERTMRNFDPDVEKYSDSSYEDTSS